MFGRQAWVGLTNATYGTLTAGRQYASYYQTMSAFSPTTWITGYYGAHPGDVDGLDTIYRANNMLEYTSPKWYGLTLSGSYSFGGVAGSTNAGSTWATGIRSFILAARYGAVPTSYPGTAHRCNSLSLYDAPGAQRERQVRNG